MNSTERVLRILQLLGSGARITTAELVRRFDDQVSRRTLQRDLNKIQASGIPLRSKKTKANENEWFLESTFRSFVPQTLTTNEYLAAHILKQDLKIFQNTTLSAEIDSLIKKLEQIVPEDVFIETEQINPGHIFDNFTSGYFDYSSYSIVINDIIHSIINRKCCQVTYQNQGTENTFQIDPRKMIHYGGGLYIIAYLPSRGDFRLLAMQRIKHLQLMDIEFDLDPPYDHQSFRRAKFGLYSGEPQYIELQFDSSIKHHIVGRIWHPSQAFEEDSEGNLILRLTVAITPELIAWVLSWRHFIKVLKPATLVSTILENVNQIQNKYQK